MTGAPPVRHIPSRRRLQLRRTREERDGDRPCVILGIRSSVVKIGGASGSVEARPRAHGEKNRLVVVDRSRTSSVGVYVGNFPRVKVSQHEDSPSAHAFLFGALAQNSKAFCMPLLLCAPAPRRHARHPSHRLRILLQCNKREGHAKTVVTELSLSHRLVLIFSTPISHLRATG